MKHTALTKNELSKLISYTNSELSKLSEILVETASVPFGPLLGLPHNNVEFALQKHRLLSKFQKPSDDMQDALWDKCMHDWMSHEEKLASYDLYGSLDKATPDVRSVIYKAKDWIKQVLKEHRFRLKLVDADLDFTPGATFIPSKGRTSVRQKLKDLDHWTVTWSALDDALELIWNTNSLKHMAIHHLQNKGILDTQVETYWCIWEHKAAFISLVDTHLLTKVNGARGSAVPKNNEKMRFINIEPMFNMLLQRCVALELRRIMKIIGNDLETGQNDHRNMISNLKVATMDLRNASDSNHYDTSKFMAPSRLWSLMDKWRSYTTTLPFKNGDEIECVNYKLSAMGNGFTFEWMTLYLLSVCRQLDAQARVYGDDIIVLADKAELVKTCLECLGWEINPDKTFINGLFRESCGAFYHEHTGYITSYDIHYCESITDVVLTCNKLRRVMHYHTEIQDTWTRLIKRLPAMLKGPISEGLSSLWVESASYHRAHRNNKNCNKRFVRHASLLRTAESLWQKSPVCVVTSFEFKSKKVWSSQADVWETADIGFYMYAGRRSDDVLRGKGRWRAVDLVIFNDGSFCRVSEIRRVRQGISKALRSRFFRNSIDHKLEKFVAENTREYALAA